VTKFDETPHTHAIDPELVSSERGPTRPVLVMIAGVDEGRSFLLETGQYILGRDREAEVHIFDDGVSRQHARIQVEGSEVRLVDLDSTNGTFVNGVLAKDLVLQEGDRLRLGQSCELKLTLQDALEHAFTQRQYDFAKRDALTGCYNKRHLIEHLSMEFSFARRQKTALSLAILDLDHFKQVNDTHGHPVGDAVLVESARRITASLRQHDVLARFGGEELVVIMRGTERVGAMVVAERLRRTLADEPFVVGELSLTVTASFGVASYPETIVEESADLLRKADEALYRAKEAGRNCCRT
jgi:diguanylate cyclase (GGDEF)-like protein